MKVPEGSGGVRWEGGVERWGHALIVTPSSAAISSSPLWLSAGPCSEACVACQGDV